MGQEELMNKIAELEREIAILPEGSITKVNQWGRGKVVYATFTRPH